MPYGGEKDKLREKSKLFLFSTSLISDQGGSSHSKSLIQEINRYNGNIIYHTYDDIAFKSHILRLIGFAKLIRQNRINIDAYYIRYTPLIFLVPLLDFTCAKTKRFVELNAYLPEELVERKNFSGLKRKLLTWIFYFDLFIIKKMNINVVAVTKEMKDELNRNGIKSYWIPNGGPKLTQLEPKPLSSQLGHLRVCFVGSIEPWQDYKLIAELPMHIKKSQVVIDVVGEGSCYHDFKREVGRLNFNDKFVFHGYLNKDRVKEIIRDADICIAPLTGSRLKKTGASPLKVLEYLAMGKPVVTTDCGSNKHIICQHSMIAFSPPGNPEAFALELMNLLSRSSSKTHEQKLKETKRNTALLNLFSWGNVFSRIMQIMETHR